MVDFCGKNQKCKTTDESFISEMLNMDVETVSEDMSFYKESLDDLTSRTIKDGSKLLHNENRLSLLTLVVYSYKEDIDLDDWLIEYAKNNNTYHADQRKNFLHMREDFEKFINKEKKKSA